MRWKGVWQVGGGYWCHIAQLVHTTAVKGREGWGDSLGELESTVLVGRGVPRVCVTPRCVVKVTKGRGWGAWPRGTWRHLIGWMGWAGQRRLGKPRDDDRLLALDGQTDKTMKVNHGTRNTHSQLFSA